MTSRAWIQAIPWVAIITGLTFLTGTPASGDNSGKKEVCRSYLQSESDFQKSLPPRLQKLLQRPGFERVLSNYEPDFEAIHLRLDQALARRVDYFQATVGGVNLRFELVFDPSQANLELRISNMDVRGLKKGEISQEIHEFYRALLAILTWTGKVQAKQGLRSVQIKGLTLSNTRLIKTLERRGFTKKNGPRCWIIVALGGAAGSQYIYRGNPDHILTLPEFGEQAAETAAGMAAFSFLGCFKYGSDYSLTLTFPKR